MSKLYFSVCFNSVTCTAVYIYYVKTSNEQNHFGARRGKPASCISRKTNAQISFQKEIRIHSKMCLTRLVPTYLGKVHQ